MAEEELVEPFEEEKLVGGCISKKIWDRICANAPDFENATLEEIEARLDPNFVPEGWLDPQLLRRRSSSYCSTGRKRYLAVIELSALKLYSNPVPSKQVSMPSAGPTSSCSGTGVPRALQQFSGLTGCTFNFYRS